MVLKSELSIVFADIVASTELFDLLGESQARETINYCLHIMSRSVLDNNGSVIKTIGDEILATFQHPDDAVEASQQMHEKISDTLVVKGRSINLRIGAHHGVVTREKNDISGAAVHLAARMAGQAKSAQIVISGYMRDLLGPIWKGASRQIDVTKVQGVTEDVTLFEIHWKVEGVTSMVPIGNFKDFEIEKSISLKLNFNGKDIIINEANPSANLGRSEENEISVNHDLVSRVHTSVELYKGKFRLQDKSTNGTYVRPASGQPVFVRRDYLTLNGNGMFGLGQDVTANSPYAIRYTIITQKSK